MRVPRIVVAGTHSGAGKPTVTLGLLRAPQRRGMIVQPFKAGPDFIDPGWQTAAVTTPEQPGRRARNLDTWLLPPATVVELFARDADGADVAVVGGMMGLYDGGGGGRAGGLIGGGADAPGAAGWVVLAFGRGGPPIDPGAPLGV